MQARQRASILHSLLVAIALVGCSPRSTAPAGSMKGSDFASQYCALAKPCWSASGPPKACESAVAAALPATIDESAGKISLDALRAAQAAPPSCADPAALVAVASAVPLDLPKAETGSDKLTVFTVVLAADGTTRIGEKAVPSDEAVLPAAKDAREKNPELRAVIKADSAVPHGRVIHVLDLLKQAQVSKIAFGVSPVPPSKAP